MFCDAPMCGWKGSRLRENCIRLSLLQKLLDAAKLTDADLRAEMEAAFRPEYITFFPENVEIAFPVGTLPSQVHCYILGLDVNEEVREILQDWTVPKLAE